MKSLIAVSLLVAGLSIVTSTQAGETPAPINQESNDQSPLELDRVFSRVPNHSEIRILSQQEMKETQGALGPVAVVVVRTAFGAAAGATTHAIENHYADRPLAEGVSYAAAVGAVGSAAAAKLVQLFGGGWPANVAWQPGIVAVEHGVQLANPANQQRSSNHHQ
jgi:hypothetical protein